MAGNRKQDPYSRFGVAEITTTSSVLVSSSQYLNNETLRNALPTALLRRNGRDRRVGWDSQHLVRGFQEERDSDHVNAMIAEARRADPRLDAWFEERHVSTFTREDLANYPRGTLGGEFYYHAVRLDLEPNLHPKLRVDPSWRPETDLEFWEVRSGQLHDFEHILAGAGFDYLGEIIPIMMRQENHFAHLPAELAAAVSTGGVLVILPTITRTILHYPKAWTTVSEYYRYAIELGRSSGPVFMANYDDMLGMTIAEARAAAGFASVTEYDSTEMSDYWSEGAQCDPGIKAM
jgi:ubiquinone biosynthesis protein Coq4